MRGKRVCNFHGGKSTGPRTEEGKARIAAAHTTFGNETRAIRAARSKGLAELMMIEDIIHLQRWTSLPRTRGPKPAGYIPINDFEGVREWFDKESKSLESKA
jgi:hypothetical protein